MSRQRAFCFTINNYTDADCDSVTALANHAQYIVCGKEVGESNTPHLQGYVYFENQRTFASVSKKLPRAHLEKAKGTPAQNREYCKKQNNILIEAGEIPSQGSRTDVAQIREELVKGSNMRQVVMVANSYQSFCFAEKALKLIEPKRHWAPEVRWYYGATGAGKTRSAVEWLEESGDECYFVPQYKFWEGYDAHEGVIIDDFRPDFCKWKDLLRLLDRHPYLVECKGASRQLVAKKMAITAPVHPARMYADFGEDVEQLLRRITQIIPVGVDPDQVKFIYTA